MGKLSTHKDFHLCCNIRQFQWLLGPASTLMQNQRQVEFTNSIKKFLCFLVH